MTAPLLAAVDLDKAFADSGLLGLRRDTGTPALAQVSLTVPEGAGVGLVGESGSGKTTLARVMAGLLRADGGRACWRGRRIEDLDRRGRKAFRREVQVVFQNPQSALNPRHTVDRILDAPLATLTDLTRPQRRARSQAVLDRVGLGPELLERYPHELSGGQAQRVAIARALAPEPRLVILDEPVSALDVSIQAQILTLLRRARSDLGLAILFISHDLAVVEWLCERVAVMHRGRIVEEGERDRVLHHPSAEYTRCLIAAVPRLSDGREQPASRQ
jgi:peptide/nickel transport system ATP-binding protein